MSEGDAPLCSTRLIAKMAVPLSVPPQHRKDVASLSHETEPVIHKARHVPFSSRLGQCGNAPDTAGGNARISGNDLQREEAHVGEDTPATLDDERRRVRFGILSVKMGITPCKEATTVS